MRKLSSIILAGLAPATVLATASLASCGGSPINNGGLIHDTNVYFHTEKLADTITVIDLSGFKSDLKDDINTTFQSLQGLIVQEKGQAELFVKSGVNERDRWLYDMQYKHHFKIHVVNNVNHDDKNEDIWDVLESYKPLFNNGKYIQYTKAINEEGAPTRDNISINNATMVSACDHYLMVSDKLVEKYGNVLTNIGITKADGAWDPTTHTAIQTFDEYMNSQRASHLDNYMLLNQDPVDFALRDYAIAAKIPTICVGLLSDDDPSTSEREKVAAVMKQNSPIFGWSHGFDKTISGCGPEQDYLIWSTTHKFNVLASDHCYNLSFYSYDKTDKPFEQHDQEKLTADPNKHYLAIVMSDGDNIQWMQNDILTSGEYWGSPYRGEFPISWTISPTPIDLNNSILEKIYAQATPNDELIAGPSGYAYINPEWYWQDDLKSSYEEFAERTAGYMHDCDLSVINPLDFKNPTYDPKHPGIPEAMTPFMKQEQVKGLVWSLDGLSLDGHGSIDWVEDKPLLSFREGIWDNDYLHRDKVLERLASYPRDPSIIDGYTALVVNVWAAEGKMYNIKEFVDQLPEDVELVTISQLLQLITDNVEHVSAVPTQYPVPPPPGE
ncbi:MAG: hypothetical protein ACOQNY_02275 [Mycoplasmoidaceae bacterium]